MQAQVGASSSASNNRPRQRGGGGGERRAAQAAARRGGRGSRGDRLCRDVSARGAAGEGGGAVKHPAAMERVSGQPPLMGWLATEHCRRETCGPGRGRQRAVRLTAALCCLQAHPAVLPPAGHDLGLVHAGAVGDCGVDGLPPAAHILCALGLLRQPIQHLPANPGGRTQQPGGARCEAARGACSTCTATSVAHAGWPEKVLAGLHCLVYLPCCRHQAAVVDTSLTRWISGATTRTLRLGGAAPTRRHQWAHLRCAQTDTGWNFLAYCRSRYHVPYGLLPSLLK